VDTECLFKALKEEWIAGAALDVLDNEPPKDSDRKLIALPNVIVTGHSAFYSDTASDESMRSAANEVGRILRGERPRCPANKEVLSKIDWFVG
jgi:D-3-phosphoglycerate dehydrogenase